MDNKKLVLSLIFLHYILLCYIFWCGQIIFFMYYGNKSFIKHCIYTIICYIYVSTCTSAILVIKLFIESLKSFVFHQNLLFHFNTLSNISVSPCRDLFIRSRYPNPLNIPYNPSHRSYDPVPLLVKIYLCSFFKTLSK